MKFKTIKKIRLRQYQKGALMLGTLFILAGLIEVVEHMNEGGVRNPYIYQDLVIYLVVFPLASAVLLRWLDRSEVKGLKTQKYLDEYLIFTRALNNTSSWSDFLLPTVHFICSKVPLDAALLYVYDRMPGYYQLGAVWWPDSETPEYIPTSLEKDTCLNCMSSGVCTLHPQIISKTNGKADYHPNRYCLPIVLSGQPTGLIQLDLPDGYHLSAEQEAYLNDQIPLISGAMSRIHLQQVLETQKDVAEQERRAIAQDLHDTLGQNVAYLHLKLDQMIVSEDTLQEVGAVKSELEKMRNIADEAYQQVRETLADLHPSNIKDFSKSLYDKATIASLRSGFKVEFNQQGSPRVLKPNIKRQLLYVCTEALNNIEKYAQATEVNVNIFWEPDLLAVRVEDNGIGFNPDQYDHQLHMGLEIMQERVDAIGAEIRIDSVLNQGTSVTVAYQYHSRGHNETSTASSIDNLTIRFFPTKQKSNEDNNR